MAFSFWQRLCRARSVLWLWNECRKRSQLRQRAVYCLCRERRMETPVSMKPTYDKPDDLAHIVTCPRCWKRNRLHRRIEQGVYRCGSCRAELLDLSDETDWSTRNNTTDVLKEIGWYPDAKTRREITTYSWRIALILSFPEAIDPALKGIFESPGEFHSGPRRLTSLLCAIPNTLLTADITDLIVIASSYESHQKDFRFWDCYYSVEQSDAALRELCDLVTPITSNVLHLAKGKKRITIPMSDDDGRSWEDCVDFDLQRKLAAQELERRGNPPYQPLAYFP